MADNDSRFVPICDTEKTVEVREKVLWDGAGTTGVDGVSAELDLKHCGNLSIFGVVSDASDVNYEVSYSGINWFVCEQISSSLPQSGDSFPKEFHIYANVGHRYVRLTSSNDVTVEAYAQARP